MAAAAALVGVLGGSGAAGLAMTAGSASAVTRAGSRTTLVGSCAGRTAGTRNCLSPQTIRQAYGITPVLARGIDGQGETVVIPSLPGNLPHSRYFSTFSADLAAYDSRYGLPPADVHVSAILGAPTRQGAGAEAVLDAETVHAVAPAARIDIVLFPPSALLRDRLPAILRDSAHDGPIVSFSYDGGCAACLTASQLRSLDGALQFARHRNVTVLAAAGDSGAAVPADGGRKLAQGVSLPASAPLVTGVGGTQLNTGPHGSYRSETVWNTSTRQVPLASGGGISTRWTRPGYQNGLPVIEDHRGVPDVSGDASTNSGFATAVVEGGRTLVEDEYGTSEAAPLWAGIVALADQAAGRPLGFLNVALYRIGHSRFYHDAFHDITRGDNGVTLPSGHRLAGYSARPGWDPVSGWGTPRAAGLVPLLDRYARPQAARGR